jgi:hypothetical protein
VRLDNSAAGVRLARCAAVEAAVVDAASLARLDANPACTVGQRIQSSLADVDRGAATAGGSRLAGATLADLDAGTRAQEFALAEGGRVAASAGADVQVRRLAVRVVAHGGCRLRA